MITGVLGGRRARAARCEWEGRPASQAIFLAPAVDAAAVGDGEVVAALEVGLGAHEAVAVRDAAALRAVRLVAVLRVDRLGLLIKLPLPAGVLAQAAADGVARRHARGAGQLLVGGGRGRGREGPDVGLAGGLVVDHRLAGHVAFAVGFVPGCDEVLREKDSWGIWVLRPWEQRCGVCAASAMNVHLNLAASLIWGLVLLGMSC